MPRIPVILAAAVLAACAPCAALAAATAFTVADTSDLLLGPAAGGQPGDVRISNDHAAFIVSAIGHAVAPAASGGTLIDAAALAGGNRRDALETSLTLTGTYPRQAVYTTLVIEQAAGPEAVVAASGEDIEDPTLTVVTRYRLAGESRTLEIETTVTNGGAEPVTVEGGDAFRWTGLETFVPGYGTDVGGTPVVAEWLGARGSPTAYACAKALGNGEFVTQGSLATATYTRTVVLPSDSRTWVRGFSAGSPDLASATDAVHSYVGTTTGLLAGTVTDALSGVGVPGAVVDLAVSAVAPYTQATPDSSGSFGVTLPQASYRLEAAAPGYYAGETDVFVIAGVTNDVELELVPEATPEGRGDTLTVVMRPILSVPAIVMPGGSFTIEAKAPESASGWGVTLQRGEIMETAAVDGAVWSPQHERWFLDARVSPHAHDLVYDLVLQATGGIVDTVAHAVAVDSAPRDEFSFVHVTDTHLPGRTYSYEPGGENDTTEMMDYRAVIEDVNIIDPAFVLLTGDLVNEGELEDYLDWHVFTKAHRISRELEVPVFIVAGNHDVGGWTWTPPSDGTARRDWWSFFGWRYLADPPPGDSIYTQNYSFDYGGVHFAGLESYDNYDGWRELTYGQTSFTPGQISWLAQDLASVDPTTPKVLFYHYDFAWQLDLEAIGVDCALWGHIHSNHDPDPVPPYDIGTDNCCSGERAYRVMRVEGGEIIPSPTLYAGDGEGDLRIQWYPSNDGTEAVVSAAIINEFGQSFERAAVRFLVPSDSLPCAVDNGELEQVTVDGGVATCLVRIDLPAHSTTYVNIAPTAVPDPGTPRLVLSPPAPSPAATGADLAFVLPSPADARLAVYDVSGRLVRTVLDEPLTAGPHTERWDLSDRSGEALASGIYFCRLEAAGESATRKLVVLR